MHSAIYSFSYFSYKSRSRTKIWSPMLSIIFLIRFSRLAFSSILFYSFYSCSLMICLTASASLAFWWWRSYWRRCCFNSFSLITLRAATRSSALFYFFMLFSVAMSYYNLLAISFSAAYALAVSTCRRLAASWIIISRIFFYSSTLVFRSTIFCTSWSCSTLA